MNDYMKLNPPLQGEEWIKFIQWAEEIIYEAQQHDEFDKAVEAVSPLWDCNSHWQDEFVINYPEHINIARVLYGHNNYDLHMFRVLGN